MFTLKQRERKMFSTNAIQHKQTQARLTGNGASVAMRVWEQKLPSFESSLERGINYDPASRVLKGTSV